MKKSKRCRDLIRYLFGRVHGCTCVWGFVGRTVCVYVCADVCVYGEGAAGEWVREALYVVNRDRGREWAEGQFPAVCVCVGFCVGFRG